MTTLEEYARHSPYSDPGRHGPLLAALPGDVRELMAVVRNVVVHYWAGGVQVTGDRLNDIDLRWVDRILQADQERFGCPLDVPRPPSQRVAGCCRDLSLLTVAALRHRGVPARSRIGFSEYLGPDFGYDHVVAEYWDGERWVFADPLLEPGPQWPFDPADLPRLVGARPPSEPVFRTAAQTWTAIRAGVLDAQRYGASPQPMLRGGWFVRNHVLQELAHRHREELLLWDAWGAMRPDLDGDLTLVDEIAALLLAADDGDAGAEQELAGRRAADPRLRPGDGVRMMSPSGRRALVDLSTRSAVPLA